MTTWLFVAPLTFSLRAITITSFPHKWSPFIERVSVHIVERHNVVKGPLSVSAVYQDRKSCWAELVTVGVALGSADPDVATA